MVANENKNQGAKNDAPAGDDVVQVPLKTLTELQEQMANLEKRLADEAAARAGLEEIMAKGADTADSPKIRERKNFEPKFRTVRISKFPMGGDYENLGYVVGWSNRGAYQEVDRTGVSPQVVDFLDLIFLDNERTSDGKLKAEKVRLLDYLNRRIQVHCKVVDKKEEPHQVPTGEEIDVSVFDPQHGLVSTGEKVDGFVTYTTTKYKIEIPGYAKNPVEVDGMYVN